MVNGRKHLRVLLLLACLCGVINGFCRTEQTKTDVTPFRTRIEYCEYEGLKLLPGSVVKNYEKCVEAKCNKGALHICGIGINAGPQRVSQDCAIIADGCQPRIVSTRPAVCGRPNSPA